MCLQESVTQKMPKMTLYTRKNIIYLFLLHVDVDKRGADVSVSRKMFAYR